MSVTSQPLLTRPLTPSSIDEYHDEKHSHAEYDDHHHHNCHKNRTRQLLRLGLLLLLFIGLFALAALAINYALSSSGNEDATGWISALLRRDDGDGNFDDDHRSGFVRHKCMWLGLAS